MMNLEGQHQQCHFFGKVKEQIKNNMPRNYTENICLMEEVWEELLQFHTEQKRIDIK